MVIPRSMRDSGRRTIVLLAAVLPWLCAGAARAHFFVSPLDRVSASPATPGTGWSAAVYLDIPDNFASSLLSAETYVASRAPDFTFHADYVDFPAGPQDSLLETDVPDMGTLLGSAATDVSDPAALAHPLGNFLIRFTGLVNVRPEVNALDIPGLPVLLDFGTQGYGGYRLRVGTTSIYRVQNHVFNGDNPFYSENALVHGFGLFPIQVTYFNRYDPTGAEGHERVGVELYSFYAGGLPWPAGTVINNPVFGPMTVTPPSAIYQPQDVPALARGDADGDGSITLADYAALQRCAGGIALDDACAVMDLDGDGTMGDFDVHWFTQLLAGPGAYPLLPGDYNADNRVDLADYRWFQWCVQPGGGDDRAGLKVGCEAFDVDANARIDAADYAVFQRFVFGPDAGP
ncbi:MAG TPA: hypothetical protein P5572_12865 [Phycisphaerae bacterium]|nr:hypothetical protein [Phycisphaerae bacterium]